MVHARASRRRLIAAVRWAPAWLVVTLASLLLSVVRTATFVGLMRDRPPLVELGITVEAFGWPLLITLLALVRRAPTWQSGEALASIWLLVAPLSFIAAAAWTRVPFNSAMRLLAPMLLLLAVFIVAIWPAGAVIIWLARRFNRRSGPAGAA